MLLPIELLASNATFALADYLTEQQWDRYDSLPPVEKVRYRYMHADCDDFAKVLRDVTGWPVVEVTSSRAGPLHRLNQAPDGRLVDATGWVTPETLKKRYRARDLNFTDPAVVDACQSILDDPEDLIPVAAAMLCLDVEPFKSELHDRITAYAQKLAEPGPDDRVLYHVTSAAALQSILADGVNELSYWTDDAGIAKYYASVLADEGHTPVRIDVRLSSLLPDAICPDGPSIREPITRELGLSEEEVGERWTSCAQTWADSLALVRSIRYDAVLPAAAILAVIQLGDTPAITTDGLHHEPETDHPR